VEGAEVRGEAAEAEELPGMRGAVHDALVRVDLLPGLLAQVPQGVPPAGMNHDTHMDATIGHAALGSARGGMLALAAIAALAGAAAHGTGRMGWVDEFMADTSAALFIGFAMAAALMAAMAPAS